MQKIINRVIRNGNNKSVPRWTALMDNVRIKLDQINKVYGDQIGYESGAIQLLRGILGAVDIDYIIKNKCSFDTFTDYFQPRIRDLRDQFNVVRRGPLKNKFVQSNSGTPVQEILLPGLSENQLMNLPFEEGFESWQFFKPVRFIHMDVPILPKSFAKSNQMIFDKSKISPMCVIINIDVTVLVYKYCIWRINQTEVNDWDTIERFFLHKYVIMPMYEDIIDSWVLSILELSISMDEEELKSLRQMKLPDSFIATGISGAYESLHRKILDFRDAKITPGDFLNTEWCLNKSPKEFYNDIQKTTEIPSLVQYAAYNDLKQLTMILLLIEMLDYQGERPWAKQFKKEIRSEVRIINSTKQFERLPRKIQDIYIDEFETIQTV